MACIVAGAHIRAAIHLLDAERETELFKNFELIRMDEFFYAKFVLARLEILPDCDDGASCVVKIAQSLKNLFLRFVESEHDS